jgi:hypothetical protein
MRLISRYCPPTRELQQGRTQECRILLARTRALAAARASARNGSGRALTVAGERGSAGKHSWGASERGGVASAAGAGERCGTGHERAQLASEVSGAGGRARRGASDYSQR